MHDLAPSYLIDGYNLLQFWRATGVVCPGDWEEVRSAFLAWLADRAPHPGKVAVVFDASEEDRLASPKGRRGKRATRQTAHGMKVLFATGYRTADDLIEELCVEHAHAGRSCTVVSNDRQVQRAARSCRFPWTSCERFLETLERAAPRPATADPHAKNVGAVEGDDTAFWMKEFAFDRAGDDQAEPKSPPPTVEPAKPPIPEMDDPFLQQFLADMQSPIDLRAPQRGRRQRQQKPDE